MQKIILIQNKTTKSALSKTQKKFNALIKKIDAKKKLLQEWQETVPIYQAKVAGEYEDLWQEYNQYRAEIVHLWDAAYEQRLFTKTDKKKLKYLINSIIGDLVFEHGMEELKDIYNKYTNDDDFDTKNQELDHQTGQLMRAMVAGMTGVDIGDDVDISSPEKFQAALGEKIIEHQKRMEENQRLQEEKRGRRKKTTKQLEKEVKQTEEAQNISKSIQEVYRKLVSLLHPDREPDEQERERKTKIMQEVNVAYEKKDLLRLLELQLELEHIDQAYLHNIAEERLVHFNKILQDQLSELEEEINSLEMRLRVQSDWPLFMNILPQNLIARIDDDIQSVINDIAKVKAEIEEFQTPENLKRFLKEYSIPKNSGKPSLDLLFQNILNLY